MEDQNVVIFLDKIKKLLEQGKYPQAQSAIEALEVELEHNIRKMNGKIIEPIHISDDIDYPVLGSYNKINEIIHFINKRFQL